MNTLREELALISKEQLQSEAIRSQVMTIIERDLMKSLEEWHDEKGFGNLHALARRFVWVAARHRNMRIKNLWLPTKTTMSWQEAKDTVQKMNGVPNKEILQDAPRR